MADAENVENIYELLDIDPPIKLTATDARQRITDALSAWNKQSGHPGFSGESARLKLERLGSLKESLEIEHYADAELEDRLEKQLKDALKRTEQRKQAKKARLKQDIRFAALNGTVLDEEITAWRKHYSDVVTEDEIEQLARSHAHTDQTSLSSQIKEAEMSLQALGEASLFSLLGLSWRASNTEVQRSADAMYRDAKFRAAKSAAWTTKMKLASLALTIFKDQAADSYRIYARQQEFYRAYLQPIAVTCDATHVITSEQAEYLRALATRDGWTADETLIDLVAVARQHGWRVLLPGTNRAESTHELERTVEEYKKRLAQINSRVEGTQQKLDEANLQLSAMQREQQRLTKQRDEAAKLAAKAQADAVAGSMKAAHSIRQERARAEAIQRQLDTLTQQIAHGENELISKYGPRLIAHMNRAELIAARGIIKSFATLPPLWTDDATRIEQGIREAERLLAEAQRAIPQVGRAEALVDAALARCADYEPARAFKASLLPAPPSGLAARHERGDVALTWNPSPSQQVRYVVIRSVGTKPLSAHDGSRIATDIKECAWRDTDPPPARPLWYAVYAERDTTSSPLAIADIAVTILPDVSDVQTEASDVTVTLSWRLPGKAHSVRVVRNDTHVPQSANDGLPFSLGQTSRYVDTGLVNGRQYYYRVYCEYTGLDGHLLQSDGIGAYAIPTSPPSAVPTLAMRGTEGLTNHTVHLDIEEPEQGSLVIYRTTEAPPVIAGTTLPITQHKERFGFDRHEVIGKRDTLLLPGAYVYTPVILFQQTALIGQSQAYIYAPAIRSLKSVDDPATGIQVRWSWPSAKCDAVEVRSQLVTASEAAPTVVHVNRTGAREGLCVLRDLPHGEYKIVVRARYQFKGQIVYSSEETAQVFHAAPMRVRYRLETQQRLMARHSMLVLTADQPLSLPDIRIVYGRKPLTAPGDGRTLCDFSPDSPLPASTWTVRLPDFTAEPDAQIHVFRTSETAEPGIIFESE